MHRALLLLLRLRLNSWFRRLNVTMKTTRGAILTIVSAIIVAGWFGSMMIGVLLSGHQARESTAVSGVERFAPMAFVAYCVLVVLSSGGGSPIMFSMAEAQFLFSGPFTRRQILVYKISNQILLTLPISLFMCFGTQAISGGLLQSWVGVALILIFLQLFGIAVNFVASVVGAWAYSHTRRIVLLLILAGMVAALIPLLRSQRPAATLDALVQVEQSEIVQAILTPPRWFVRVITVRDFSEWLKYVAAAMSIDAGLLALVFLLDAGYVEAAAAASERRYARVQRMRSGGITAVDNPTRIRYSVPNLPWWGGIGPVAWRQLVVASRAYRSYIILLFVIGMSSIGPMIGFVVDEKHETTAALSWTIIGIGLTMSALMSQLFPFDFRSDVDRIEVLKTWPIPAWRIAAGQLFVPAFCSSVFQILFVGAVYAMIGHVGYGFLGTVVLALPVNFLLTGIDNLLFLLFPTRLVKTNDLSQTGRNMMLMFAKMTAVFLGVGVPVGIGAIAFFVFGHSWLAACAAAWFFAVCASLVPVPLVAAAFRHFDVARDTPP